MLQVKNIKKSYKIGESSYPALKGVSMNFRQNEFVAILGESGSGKTTLLNLIGGLDQYNSGDLVIDGATTKEYRDQDWDSYRNHQVGFVFQSYNLISHLDIVTNVELALSLSGVSAAERRDRSIQVLKRVGLEDHLTKKPSQLSGGQQQRVAIARALVNNPSIVLADEPTGALDSETSAEIMSLLLEVAKDKLIIMVTHNGELAEEYADRIIQLKDGLVISDSNPYEVDQEVKRIVPKQTSMGFLTALMISGKNLFTKKARTLITAIAGSIGIIGVALVLSLQYGFTNYLNTMERDTFAGLPITINKNYIDLEALSGQTGRFDSHPEVTGGIGGYEPTNPIEIVSGTNLITNDYISYLQNSKLSEHGTIVETHDFTAQYLYYDIISGTIEINPTTKPSQLNPIGNSYINQSVYSSGFYTEYFDVIKGSLPNASNLEAVLVVNEDNRVPYRLLEFLGIDIDNIDTVIDFTDIVGKKFHILTNDIYYKEDPNNSGHYIRRTESEIVDLFPNSNSVVEVTISGIIKSNTPFVSVNEQIIYNQKVKEEVMALQKNSEVATIQATKTGEDVIYNNGFLTPTTVEEALIDLGYNDVATDISIYPNSFDDKEEITKILDEYNQMVENDGNEDTLPIKYTDNIVSALSMMKTILNSITVVLIAFSSISLIVSSVMIGVIMYTSVLERTKEIGILRSIGARKKDISRVFNAESISVGFIAGTIGVLFTFAVVPLINILLYNATEQSNIAELSIYHAIILIIISIFLTFISGLIPSRLASKKDPVTALRND